MKKRFLSLVLVLALCFCCAAFAEEEETGTYVSFRSLPGYTCFPLSPIGEWYGSFCVDCPMEWDGDDYSEAYEVPTVMGIDPNNPGHHVMIAELSISDQLEIMQDDSNPLSGFYWEATSVVQGRSTEGSKILEQFDLHGLPATRVEMVGQGYEMIWILDQPQDFPVGGDLWFFMYPTDPDDAEYTATVAEMVDSFTAFAPYCVTEAPASDFEYTVDGDEVCLTAYTGNSAYVVVPSEIDGKPVTSMGSQAFYEKSVRCVRLPESIRTMGRNTFGGCTHMVYSIMPDALEVLPGGTFESCFRLIDPGLNDGLKRIETNAFFGATCLPELWLPESLEEIEDGAFVLCNYLDCIHAAKDSRFFRNEDGHSVLLSADGSKLIHVSYLRDGNSYTVPDGVKQIYAYAFSRVNLTGGVTLPDGLEYIGFSAFPYTGLTELHIPQSVKDIGIMQNVHVDGSDEPTTAYTSVCETLKKVYGIAGSPAMDYAERNNLEFVPVLNVPAGKREK